jgi:hypothetical protein
VRQRTVLAMTGTNEQKSNSAGLDIMHELQKVGARRGMREALG